MPISLEAIEQVQEKDEMAELLEMSPKISAAEAKTRVQKLKKTIERLRP